MGNAGQQFLEARMLRQLVRTQCHTVLGMWESSRTLPNMCNPNSHSRGESRAVLRSTARTLSHRLIARLSRSFYHDRHRHGGHRDPGAANRDRVRGVGTAHGRASARDVAAESGGGGASGNPCGVETASTWGALQSTPHSRQSGDAGNTSDRI